MIARTPRRRSGRSAFTLTEMLVVVAIILTLAAIAVPISFSVYESSQRDAAKIAIKSILVPAVGRYRLDHDNNPEGALPGSLQDLLTSEKVGLKPDQLIDPWGQQYQYSPETNHNSTDGFDIWSTGNGGKQVGNWKD